MFKLHLKKQKTVLYSIFKKPLSDIKSAISSCGNIRFKAKIFGENVSSRTNMENHLNAKLREARLNSKPVLPTRCHSRQQSRLVLLAAGDWARGPRGSGDIVFDWLSRNNKI